MDTMLSKKALRVLVALCGHANKKDICRPSQARLAKVSNLSRQKVNMALKELCERQWITLVGKRRGRGQWPSNVYKVNFNRPVEGAITPLPRHPKGDTNHVTPPVTSRRHPTGDTNKPIEQKRKEQRRNGRPKQSPFKTLVGALESNGMSTDQAQQLIDALELPKYEEYCRELSSGHSADVAVTKLLSSIDRQPGS